MKNQIKHFSAPTSAPTALDVMAPAHLGQPLYPVFRSADSDSEQQTRTMSKAKLQGLRAPNSPSGSLAPSAPCPISSPQGNRVDSMRDIRIPRPWDSPTGRQNGLNRAN